MKRSRIVAGVVLLGLIGGGVYYALRQHPSVLIVTGIVNGHDVVVSSKILGRIDSLRVQDGQRVRAGEVVAVLDHRQLTAAFDASRAAALQARQLAIQAGDQLRLTRASVAAKISEAEAQVEQAVAQHAQAQATLEQAAANARRIEALYLKGVETAQNRDNARTALDADRAGVAAANQAVLAARAALRDAEAQRDQVPAQVRQLAALRAAASQAGALQQESRATLAQTRVLAPVSGVISLRAAREGEVVNPGDPIVTIFQLSNTWVEAFVPETDADLVRLGQTLTVKLPSGAEIKGPVIYKAVEASFATLPNLNQTARDIKTVAIRVRVPNHDERLARGMTAYVLLPLGGKDRP